ncbi:MAG: hypothetical protein AAGU32_13515 [Bacillota bacterium]
MYSLDEIVIGGNGKTLLTLIEKFRFLNEGENFIFGISNLPGS